MCQRRIDPSAGASVISAEVGVARRSPAAGVDVGGTRVCACPWNTCRGRGARLTRGCEKADGGGNAKDSPALFAGGIPAPDRRVCSRRRRDIGRARGACEPGGAQARQHRPRLQVSQRPRGDSAAAESGNREARSRRSGLCRKISRHLGQRALSFSLGRRAPPPHDPSKTERDSACALPWSADKRTAPAPVGYRETPCSNP